MTTESLLLLVVPEPSMSAPLPTIIATDNRMAFAYFVERSPIDAPDAIAIIRPQNCSIHKFGAPNEEGILGHHLFPEMQAIWDTDAFCGAEVRNSQWIAELERMNQARPLHTPSSSPARRHFIFAFHDSTLEFVADGFEVEIAHRPFGDILHELLDEF